MEQIVLTFEEIKNESDSAIAFISRENLKEIKEVCKKTIKYLTNFTLIFLENINGRWYVN